MTTPVPAPKIHELVDRLTSIRFDAVPSHFAMARFEAEARREIPYFPEVAYTAIGIIGLLLADRHKAEDAIRNALKLSPNHPDVIKNAISILSTFGNAKEAAALIDSIPTSFFSEKEMLQCAILGSVHTLQFDKALGFIERLEKLIQPNESHRLLPLKPQIGLHAAAARRLSLSDDDLTERLEVAVAAVRESKKDVCQTSLMTTGDGTFLYGLFVNANAKECADINCNIADALVENFEDPGGDYLSFMCVPLSGFYGSALAQGIL